MQEYRKHAEKRGDVRLFVTQHVAVYSVMQWLCDYINNEIGNFTFLHLISLKEYELWVRYLGLRGRKNQEAGDKCMRRSFTIYSPQQILLGHVHRKKINAYKVSAGIPEGRSVTWKILA
jgi:hypothetical protein